jgi:hypothetical protein
MVSPPYSKIDWGTHGRLTHLRNRGIAHLTPEEMEKSVTIEELRSLVAIISRLATTLRDLCQSQFAFHADMLEEYRDLARRAIKTKNPIQIREALDDDVFVSCHGNRIIPALLDKLK